MKERIKRSRRSRAIWFVALISLCATLEANDDDLFAEKENREQSPDRGEPVFFTEDHEEYYLHGISVRIENSNYSDGSEVQSREVTEKQKKFQETERRQEEFDLNFNRIIGGKEAKKGRYPYLASLTNARSHTCGGTLIADDIILSAAHCAGYFDGIDLGRHDVKNKMEIFERFNIERVKSHPGYNKEVTGSYDNDYMIAKLYGWSADRVLANINPFSNVPSDGKDLHVTGWGVVNYETKEVASYLRDVSVYYIPNEECKKRTGRLEGYSQLFTLANKVTDNMMCALDEGEDACQGDSGGPLIIRGATAAQDNQVGIVSWGLGCAHATFPGLYARTSSKFTWIQNHVCAWAENPPAYFDCSPRLENGNKPTRAVTVELKLDRFPKENGWMIRDEYGKTVAYMAIGSYWDVEDNHQVTTLQLKEDTNYEFIMLDSYGDGIKFDSGYYKLWFGDAPYIGMIAASGNIFEKDKIHKFYLPKMPKTQPPVPAPTKPPASTPVETSSPSLAPTQGEQYFITIGFKFDLAPEDTAWALTSVDTESLVASKSFGTYADKDNEMVFERVDLPLKDGSPKGEFVLAILDAGRNGLCCDSGDGFYQVFFGDIADGKILYTGGKFRYLEKFIFNFDGQLISSPPVFQSIGSDRNSRTSHASNRSMSTCTTITVGLVFLLLWIH